MTSRVVTAGCPGGTSFAARPSLHYAVVAVFLSVLSVSVPSKPNQAESNAEARSAASRTQLGPTPVSLLGSLEVGLAGPPVLGADGTWWALGRDGELERFRADDALNWSISMGAAISGEAATDERGQLLFVPTARDLVVALDPLARVHWRYRAPAGIAGPVSWVPGQGLAFFGRDHALYWLDVRANLVLRAPLKERISYGPTPFGGKILLGTDDGQLVALSRQGRRQSASLGGRVTAIMAVASGILVLAAGTAYWLDVALHPVWSRPDILGIGVTAARGHESRPATPVTLSISGEVEWLDAEGRPVARAASKPAPGAGCAPEIAATDTRAWAVDDSGTLWEARAGGGWTPMGLSTSALLRPIVDLKGGRVLVGASDGSVWSRTLGPDTSD